MNIRDNKGITLMAEVITIMLFTLILSVITYSSLSSVQLRKLNNMYSDIVSIQEKAQIYYSKYGNAPISGEPLTGDIIDSISNEKNPNDVANEYYKIDFALLKNLSLNNKQTNENYYFINKETMTVYYSKGVEVDNLDGNKGTEVYHTLPSNYKGISKIELSDYQ